MPRKKSYYNHKTGWGGEARAEDIEYAVSSRVNLEGPRIYNECYQRAKKLLKEGLDKEHIIEKLKYPQNIQSDSAASSPGVVDQIKINNQAERKLSRISQKGVEDALNGLPPEY